MKKGLLFLLAIFSIGIARAQVEVTDVSGMDYALYFDNPLVTAGKETTVPLYMKSLWGVQGIQGDWDLPEGFSVTNATANPRRYDSNNKGIVFTANDNRVVATILSDKGYYAGDDVWASVTFNVADDVAPGEYTITFSNVKFGGFRDESGNPADKEDFFLDPIVCKITVTNDIHLYDIASAAPANNTAGNFVVHRTIKAKEWSTICLPFALTGDQVKEAFGEDVQFADFAGAEFIDGENINVKFTTVDAVKDGTKNCRPYIIKVSKEMNEIRIENATVKRAGSNVTVGTNFFRGTLVATTVPEENLYLSGNRFYYSIGKTQINGFRGYFQLSEVLDEYWDAAEVKVNLVLDDVTKIDNIDNMKSNGDIYNLNGIKIGTDQKNLGKGVYIINGKKIVK